MIAEKKINDINQMLFDVNTLRYLNIDQYTQGIFAIYMAYNNIEKQKILINYLEMNKVNIKMKPDDVEKFDIFISNLKNRLQYRQLNNNKTVSLMNDTIKKPVYILLTHDGENASDVKSLTDKSYDMISLSFESDLKNLYTFFESNKKHTMTDSIDNYTDKNYSLYTIFLNLNDFNIFVNKIKDMNSKNINYNLIGLFNFIGNIPIEKRDMYFIEKFIKNLSNICHAHIQDATTAFISKGEINSYDSIYTEKRIKELIKLKHFYDDLYDNYENVTNTLGGTKINKNDFINDYNKTNPTHTIGKNRALSENVSMNVNKPSFKISVDDNGDFIIEKQETINFMDAYMASHKLLLLYSKNKNIEGMKYELSKLWYMIMVIESKVLYHTSKIRKLTITEEKRKQCVKARAFILNDFNKYMKEILKEEPDFNFDEYFMYTKFGVSSHKIDQKTIRAMKNVIFNLIR